MNKVLGAALVVAVVGLMLQAGQIARLAETVDRQQRRNVALDSMVAAADSQMQVALDSVDRLQTTLSSVADLVHAQDTVMSFEAASAIVREVNAAYSYAEGLRRQIAAARPRLQEGPQPPYPGTIDEYEDLAAGVEPLPPAVVQARRECEVRMDGIKTYRDEELVDTQLMVHVRIAEDANAEVRGVNGMGTLVPGCSYGFPASEGGDVLVQTGEGSVRVVPDVNGRVWDIYDGAAYPR